MLQVSHLTISHRKDLRTILEDFSFVLNRGDRAVLVGEEGNGKSTLLRWIVDPALVEDYAEAEGTRTTQGELIGYLPQELPEEDREKSAEEYFAALPAFQRANAAELHRIASELHFDEPLFHSTQRMGSLSGGERVKAQMAGILLARPDFLLLDEPSNDIDIETLEWLERLINGFPGGVLFISHDETLIERTANRVVLLEQLRRKSVPRATVANVSDTIMDVADEVVEKLQASEEFAGAADGYAESREEIKKNIEDILSQFADEDGHIASDEVITQQLLPILSDFLSSGKIELPEGISVPGMIARPGDGMTVTLLSSTEGAPEEKTPDAEELGDAIAKFIDERIDEKTVNRITTVLEGFGVSVLIVFAFWAFLALKALFKSFSGKNPGVRMWAPIVFGWPHFLFLFLLPMLLLINGGAFLTSFAGMTGAPTETVKGLLEGIRISFSTCGTVSAVCALTLMIISIFYAPQRKKLSNIYG